MIAKPRFKSSIRIEITAQGVFVLSERKVRLLKGRLYTLVVPQIDGLRSCDEIADSLRSQASAEEVYYILARLQRSGFLEEALSSAEGRDILAYWDHLQAYRVGPGRLSEASVSVVTAGRASAEPFLEALSRLGITLEQEGDLRVVVTDDYLGRKLESLNRDSLRSGKDWMLFKPVGSVIWLGPIFSPGKTPCWECLAHSLKTNRPVEAHLERLGRPDPYYLPEGFLPTTLQAACCLAATEVARWIAAPDQSPLKDALYTLDLVEWRLEKHSVRRRMHCPACGIKGAKKSHALPIRLQSRPNGAVAGGGYRTVPLRRTWEDYRHLVSPLTGVLSRLVPALPAEQGFPGVFLGLGGAVSATGKGLDRVLAGTGSGGKGETDLAAKVGALCEAVERFSAVFQGDEPRVRCRYRDLEGTALHPSRVLHFSQSQYQCREQLNAQASHRSAFIPAPFQEESEVDWTPLWSLTRQAPRHLPTAYCYFDYPESGTRFCWADSNGCAAGNNLEEAILQGFLELVERDAVALWWYNKSPRPALDLATFNQPYIARLADFYRSLRREFWVLDITSDLEIPAFAAVSCRRSNGAQAPRPQQIFVGFGAHFDPVTALSRSLTEMNQFLPAVAASPDRDGLLLDDPPLQEWLQKASLEDLPYLAPDAGQDARTRSHYPFRPSFDLLQDIQECVSRAERLGMETLVLDQSRPELGLSVVRVVVPGLRHFWPRFGRGRLYDVPARLGWIPRPLEERELNPVPIFW